MKSIESLKKLYEKFYAEKISKGLGNRLSHKEQVLYCSVVAELQAYFKHVIPEGFNGRKLFGTVWNIPQPNPEDPLTNGLEGIILIPN